MQDGNKPKILKIKSKCEVVLTCSRDSQSPHWPLILRDLLVTYRRMPTASLLRKVTMRQAQLALSNGATRGLANHTSLSYAH